MVGGNRARVKRKENQVKGKKYILTESGRKGQREKKEKQTYWLVIKRQLIKD